MNNIECFTQIEIPEYCQEVIEEVSTCSIKNFSEEFTVLVLPEDQIYSIPSSSLEIHHIGSA
jgi:hypothetical protein